MRFDRRTMNAEREERARLREVAVQFNVEEERLALGELEAETGLSFEPETYIY